VELIVDKPDAQSKSVWYLIAAAVGWETLALLPALLLHLRVEYAQSRAVPLEDRALLIEIAKLLGYATVLLGNYIQGRVIGRGNVRTGLGDQPISQRPIVVLMAILIAAYAVLWDAIHYVYYRDLVYQQYMIYTSNPWSLLDLGFGSVLLAPLSEELFFRGWLWTGLRKHWGALPTGVLTGTIWLALHSASIVVWLLPVAVMLSIARHFGQSVRVSITLHMLYNFIGLISPLVLNAAGLF
jgi:membrane protease YdiL (CAAX protease family)